MARLLLPGLLLLGLAACDRADILSPNVWFVWPRDGDTLEPAVHIIRAIAEDDQEMLRVFFWQNGEMIGMTWRARGDTFAMGWDCRADTSRRYELQAEAQDHVENTAFHRITVLVRR